MRGWLVLSRKPHQKVFIESSDGLIEVVVDRICPDCVKLALRAPSKVRIVREEVMKREKGNTDG